MAVVGRQRVAVRVQQLTRHAEVNQENATTLESNNQILAAAIERGDSFSLELGGDPRWVERPGETWIGDRNAFEATSDELWLEALADDLDFG